MPRHTKPLSDKEVRHAKSREKAYYLHDGDGLRLKVNPSGSKIWYFRYRFDGKENTLSLGRYPTVTLQEARAQREELRKLIAQGKNPSDIRKHDKQPPANKRGTQLSVIAKQWLKSIEDPTQEFLNTLKHKPNYNEKVLKDKIAKGQIIVNKPLAKSTLNRHRNIVENYILPAFKEKPITEVTEEDIITFLENVVAGGTTEMSTRTHITLKAIWKYAIDKKFVDKNIPLAIDTSRILPKYEHQHHRSIVNPEEIKNFLCALENYDGYILTKYALKFQVLTAVRPGNIRNAKWDQIDWDKAQWIIPDGEMKSRRQFIMPLSKQALSLLKTVKQYSFDSEYIFPSSRRINIMLSENTLNKAVKKLTSDKMVSHGVRSMFSTAANDYGDFDRTIIDAALAHKIGDKTEQSYNRAQYITKRATLMQWWADWLDNLVEEDSK